MQKISSILFLVVIISGCSVLKKGSDKYAGDSDNYLPVNNIQSTKSKNITANSFFIEKAEIEIVSPGLKEKFLGSIKFEKEGKYLISLKSLTGIEVARIFVSEDTLLANDRINRKLYYGYPDYFLRKYGIPEALLPVIFGDLVGDKIAGKDSSECIDGRLNQAYLIKGIRMLYVIDCKKNKIISAVPENSFRSESFRINYTKFTKRNELIFPVQIDITDTQRNTTIKIKIIKITSGLKDKIEFIPGNKYELIRLL